jgi:hypothetical protein
LDIDTDARIPDAFKKVIQSIIVASTEWRGRADVPLIRFASQLSSAVSGDDFDRILQDVWPNGDSPLKSAAILWNSWVEWAGNSLPLRRLAETSANSGKLFLSRLPTQFSDLFTSAFFGTELAADSAWHPREFFFCLKCGQLIPVHGEIPVLLIGHGTTCGAVLFMKITGQDCTQLVSFDFVDDMEFVIRPIYLTEAGDESVGLVLGLPLVLSESRRRTVIVELLSGQYCV